jgi:hypothetical protein
MSLFFFLLVNVDISQTRCWCISRVSSLRKLRKGRTVYEIADCLQELIDLVSCFEFQKVMSKLKNCRKQIFPKFDKSTSGFDAFKTHSECDWVPPWPCGILINSDLPGISVSSGKCSNGLKRIFDNCHIYFLLFFGGGTEV